MSQLVCLSSSKKPCTRLAVKNNLCKTCLSNQWQKQNRRSINEQRKGYWAKRYQTDPQYKMKSKIRAATSTAVKNNDDRKQVRFIGCTAFEFNAYLLSQFTGDMSFDNYGSVWELDHIIELSKFDLTDPAQITIAAHYSNIRPLLIEQNRQQKAEDKEVSRKQVPLQGLVDRILAVAKAIESEKGVA